MCARVCPEQQQPTSLIGQHPVAAMTDAIQPGQQLLLAGTAGHHTLRMIPSTCEPLLGTQRASRRVPWCHPRVHPSAPWLHHHHHTTSTNLQPIPLHNSMPPPAPPNQTQAPGDNAGAAQLLHSCWCSCCCCVHTPRCYSAWFSVIAHSCSEMQPSSTTRRACISLAKRAGTHNQGNWHLNLNTGARHRPVLLTQPSQPPAHQPLTA